METGIEVVFPPSVKESGTNYTATKVIHPLILEDKGEQTSVPKEHLHNTQITCMKTHEILSHTKHNVTIIWAIDSVFHLRFKFIREKHIIFAHHFAIYGFYIIRIEHKITDIKRNDSLEDKLNG